MVSMLLCELLIECSFKKLLGKCLSYKDVTYHLNGICPTFVQVATS